MSWLTNAMAAMVDWTPPWTQTQTAQQANVAAQACGIYDYNNYNNAQTQATNTAMGVFINPNGNQVWTSHSTGTTVFAKPQPPVVYIMEEDLNQPVYSMAVDSLCDLWVQRYGNDWIDVDDVVADEFYKHAYARLHDLGRLEMHYITNKSKYVCRKPE